MVALSICSNISKNTFSFANIAKVVKYELILLLLSVISGKVKCVVANF